MAKSAIIKTLQQKRQLQKKLGTKWQGKLGKNHDRMAESKSRE
jgi:hypothetical protein